MGTDREVNLDQLAAATPKGREFWSRDQENTYLARVQRRAEEQARTLLAQVERERAALLEDARGEAARILEEAGRQAAALLDEQRRQQADAAHLHEEARLSHAEADRLRAEAGAAGHAAGMEQARADLEHFRAVMGESVGAVLTAVHAQCDHIFAIWKEELCALLTTCVEKGSGLVLDKDRALLLEQIFTRSVRLFAARSEVLVRVRQDDEALVADMLAAARERVAGLDAWSVRGDADLAPGDLVLETAHGRVESRIAERSAAVDAALRHLTLPVLSEEESAREEMARAHADAVERMVALALQRASMPPAAQDNLPADTDARAEATASAHGEAAAEQPGPDPVEENAAPPFTPQVDVPAFTDAVDAVLAEGGFLPGEE